MQIEKRMKPMLGTFIEIGLAVDSQMHSAFDAAFFKIEQIQSLMSFHNPKSELSKINKHPYEWVQVSRQTAQVFRLAKQLSERSQGLFNPTVGGELIELRVLPNHFIRPFELKGSEKDIEIDGQNIRLNAPFLVTLDGIAKGYAVDQAVAKLQSLGIEHGWINAGGDIRVFGNLKLPVALRHQETTDTRDMAVCELQNQAIASSHIGRPIDETFPGHILATDNRKPTPALVSVVAKEAWLADGLTKVLGLANEEERDNFAQAFDVSYYHLPY